MPVSSVSSSARPQHQPAPARSTRRKGVTKKPPTGGFTNSLSPDQETAIVGAIVGTASVGPTIYGNATGASETLFDNIDPPFTFACTITSLFQGFSNDRQTARKRRQAEKAAQTAEKQARLQEQEQLAMQKSERGRQKKHEVIQMAMLPLISTAMFAACVYARGADNCTPTPDQSKHCKALDFMALASLVGIVLTVNSLFWKIVE